MPRCLLALLLALLALVTGPPGPILGSHAQQGQRSASLSPGCGMATLTFPTGTGAATVASAVTPPIALDTIWRLDNPTGSFQAYSLAAPQASDLLSVNPLDAVFLCVHEPAVIAMPAVSVDASGADTSVSLGAGCNAVGLSYPDGTVPFLVAESVAPSEAFDSMWRLDNVTGVFQAYGAAAPGASDLANLRFLDAVFVCVAHPASLNMPALARMSTGVSSDKWDLWIGGTQLRGANIYQAPVWPELDGPEFKGSGAVGPPYTQQDFDRLAALGANYVNVSHPGLFTEKSPYQLDQDIQTNLDNLLDMIASADMFAVISFRTGPGRSEFTFFFDEDWFDESYLNDSVWQDQAAQDAWVEMWRHTAERCRGNPVVVGYDLMVEPNADEVLLGLYEPDEFYPAYEDSLYDWNQLHPRIAAAIREVDPDTPILVGGMGYSGVGWLPYIQTSGDPHTVYVMHQYAPSQYTHQSPPPALEYPGTFDANWDGVDDQVNRTWLDSLLSAVDDFIATRAVPVAVNEFGLARWQPGAADFMDDQMGLFEERGMNYALWMWDPSWEPWTEENDAFNFRHGPDPENHADVASSELMDVIVKYWQRNTVRPSNDAQ